MNYVDKCKEKYITPVKEWQYRHMFNNKFNLSFHQPHSDTCKKCDFFKKGLKTAKTQSAIKDMQRPKTEESP
jgi:hypothetical protein